MINYYNDHNVKLRGPGITVHADETMLNHKVKNHCVCGHRKQTWAICIVDTSFVLAKGNCEIIPNKRAETLIPIIARVVREGSNIHIDELISDNRLSDLSYDPR
ncbi:hypothetical protein MXB_2893 [Myxobolus squamalis]|nr:hypothetical protein MXB_2893 [Myxobolus squamalis]